ncbi:rhodanese-like domain-containing protein [Halolamina sp. CBA1230]|uniref:rhodanese-like domain-containing protein n=1 Tax=Halolamina sp. CBA1230 TaxID=1853690 RepID=UPI0009A2500A|nr:rhodanese-like domain-containing protein [Halolamina sp. CBA1230]QKY19498.1 rhodanese-like domain-containing protein [Halolamina sp. CBA1230]
MDRREYLAALGTASTVAVAGCSSGGGSSGGDAPFEHPGTIDETMVANGDYPDDDDPADGLPPEFQNPPESPGVDPDALETISVNDETVQLLPIEDARAWFLRSEARFVDARGLDQYTRSHLYGSVLSPAQQGSTGGGIEGWPTDGRIVAYCGCPHHLSSLRAAGLQKAGYESVYVIDEGFREWSDQGYPMAGTAFGEGDDAELSEWRIDGEIAADYAGEYAWATVGRQYEAAPIGDDGRFSLHLYFAGVDADTDVRVSTPAFTRTRPLGEVGEGPLR